MENEILNNPIIKRVIDQQVKGYKKYGELVTPDNLTIDEWLEHLAQELTDALVYIECIRAKLKMFDDEKKTKPQN